MQAGCWGRGWPQASPDGYTFTLISSSYTVNPSLYKLKSDPVADITPIVQASTGPLLAVVHPDVPARMLAELTALAKSKPGELSYASSGQGSALHLGPRSTPTGPASA